MVKKLVATYKWENNGGGGDHTIVDEEEQLESKLIEFLEKLKQKYPLWGNYIITSKNIYEIEFEDSSTGENINDRKKQLETPNDIEKNATTDPSVNIPTGLTTSDGKIVTIEDVVNSFSSYAAWDPRLIRHDEYFSIGGDNGIKVPFSSDSAISAFADYSDVIEAGVLQNQVKANKNLKNSRIGKIVNTLKTGTTAKVIANDTKVFKDDPNFYGVQSIVNPYTITKLCGGLELSGGNVKNYMYDIRDQRRFYAVHGNSSNDVLSISNPTVTELINWSNSDLWGRTPYSFQDFVYCKYFGLIPNNRLITLRRYAVPTFDNLQFENMISDNDKNKENAGKQGNPNNKTFSPIAYVVTWFGGETGNSLSTLMSFTTGLQWEDVTSQVWSVNGEDGETKQAVIDKMLSDGGNHTGAFGTAEYTPLNSLFSGASWVSSKIASFGKFALALKSEKGFGESQDVYEHRIGAQVDPFDTTFLNKTKGPLNAIMSVKKRKQGIEFSQAITIKCAYQAKAIGGINPKAALLDVLGNCMEIVSPHAVFWGGGHRFMVRPQIYPFSDGGWRDSFMAKIYNGEFLGKDGAIARVLRGLSNVGNNGEQFDFSIVKNIFGGAAGLIGGVIQSVSNILQEGGVGFLNGLANSVFDIGGAATGQDISQQGTQMAKNLFKSIGSLWRNRMFVATTQPKITATGNILIGEPTGEWHLTVGNPLNPIMVIGNLICKDMKVKFSDEIGPDDFPTEFEVEYTLEHAMARDSDAIQSMFNRGMGKFYTLPDYVSTSSDYNTAVDKYTKDDYIAGVTGDFGYIQGGNTEFAGAGQNKYHITPGIEPPNHGSYSTQLITKFNPLNTQAQRKVKELKTNKQQAIVPKVRSLAAIRKLTTV